MVHIYLGLSQAPKPTVSLNPGWALTWLTTYKFEIYNGQSRVKCDLSSSQPHSILFYICNYNKMILCYFLVIFLITYPLFPLDHLPQWVFLWARKVEVQQILQVLASLPDLSSAVWFLRWSSVRGQLFYTSCVASHNAKPKSDCQSPSAFIAFFKSQGCSSIPVSCQLYPFVAFKLHTWVWTNVRLVYRWMHAINNQHQEWYQRTYPWVSKL